MFLGEDSLDLPNDAFNDLWIAGFPDDPYQRFGIRWPDMYPIISGIDA